MGTRVGFFVPVPAPSPANSIDRHARNEKHFLRETMAKIAKAAAASAGKKKVRAPKNKVEKKGEPAPKRRFRAGTLRFREMKKLQKSLGPNIPMSVTRNMLIAAFARCGGRAVHIQGGVPKILRGVLEQLLYVVLSGARNVQLASSRKSLTTTPVHMQCAIELQRDALALGSLPGLI